MPGRGIPRDFDPNVVETIQDRLAAVELDSDVSLILAVESGSRAWGFSSSDSDYDCRFLYRRRPDRYLSLWPIRDVIETPLDRVYDVNGWDIGKALRLLVKGNAVAIEWLMSPIVYRDDSAVRQFLTEFARDHADPSGVRRHYFHLATQQYERHLATSDRWKIKSLFYVLRPIAALRWLRHHPKQVAPPMNLWDLMNEANMSRDTIDLARSYAEIKASAPESQEVSSDRTLTELFVEELSLAGQFDPKPTLDGRAGMDAADRLFQQIIAMPWNN